MNRGITRDDILHFLYTRGGECTFAEVSRLMHGARGGYDLLVPNNPRAVVWWQLGLDFIRSIDELREEGRIFYSRTDPEVYDIFGMRPPFPVVPKNGVCKVKSWLPVLIEMGKKP